MMHKSYKNACGLIEDAEVLLRKRPARALSLAVVAIEETAKVIMLADAAAQAAGATTSWQKIEDKLKLRSHQTKQTTFALYGSKLLDPAVHLTEGPGKYYTQQIPDGMSPLLDYFKQLGFYVDVVDGRFISPDDFGRENRQWTKWLIAVAKERLASFAPLHGTDRIVDLDGPNRRRPDDLS